MRIQHQFRTEGQSPGLQYLPVAEILIMGGQDAEPAAHHGNTLVSVIQEVLHQQFQAPGLVDRDPVAGNSVQLAGDHDRYFPQNMTDLDGVLRVRLPVVGTAAGPG